MAERIIADVLAYAKQSIARRCMPHPRNAPKANDTFVPARMSGLTNGLPVQSAEI
jgi:hypothetical protein